MSANFSNTDQYVKRVELPGIVGTTIAVTNKASGGTIGTAPDTVDVAAAININQTTASQTLTIPDPTTTSGSYRIPINNVGSTSFTLLSTVIAPGAGILVDWTSTAWSVIGTSSGATNVTVAGGKTFTVSNTLTLAGTDGTTITFPTTSATVARTDAANTFTGVQTMTSPVLITPILGVATATSYNGLTLTTTTGTFTLTNGKTLAVTGTLTLSGTDSTVMTFPSTSQTVVGLTATQTLTNKTLTSPTMTAPVLGVATGTSVAVSGLLTTSSASANFGYATGAGGAVSQSTNKSTGVTLDTNCGAITMNNVSLAAAATVSFTLTNAQITATDVVAVSIKSGASTGLYTAAVTATGAGSCQISVTNIGSTAGEVVIINFAVISCVAA